MTQNPVFPALPDGSAVDFDTLHTIALKGGDLQKAVEGMVAAAVPVAQKPEPEISEQKPVNAPKKELTNGA